MGKPKTPYLPGPKPDENGMVEEKTYTREYDFKEEKISIKEAIAQLKSIKKKIGDGEISSLRLAGISTTKKVKADDEKLAEWELYELRMLEHEKLLKEWNRAAKKADKKRKKDAEIAAQTERCRLMAEYGNQLDESD